MKKKKTQKKAWLDVEGLILPDLTRRGNPPRGSQRRSRKTNATDWEGPNKVAHPATCAIASWPGSIVVQNS